MEAPITLHSRDALLTVFDQFRDELDDHNDRRERLIKSTRDVTNLSKKVIFLLHRTIAEPPTSFSEHEHAHDDRLLGQRAAARAKDKLLEIRQLFAAISHELAGDAFSRYRRNVSAGLQEYIEALSFAHYLECGALISYDRVQASLCDDRGTPYFPLPLEDYLLGLSDLTGELMRYAIATIPRRGGRQRANDVCAFVRACKADFEVWTPHFRELRKKQYVTAQSLQKIEDAAYAIAVRTSEYSDLPPEMLEDLVAQTVARATEGEDSRRRRGEDEDGGGNLYQ